MFQGGGFVAVEDRMAELNAAILIMVQQLACRGMSPPPRKVPDLHACSER
jgi:hypothetical protein